MTRSPSYSLACRAGIRTHLLRYVLPLAQSSSLVVVVVVVIVLLLLLLLFFFSFFFLPLST